MLKVLVSNLLFSMAHVHEKQKLWKICKRKPFFASTKYTTCRSIVVNNIECYNELIQCVSQHLNISKRQTK